MALIMQYVNYQLINTCVVSLYEIDKLVIYQYSHRQASTPKR